MLAYLFVIQTSVIATAAELNITVLAYSPLGRGFLTGQITKLEDIPEGDIRRHVDRFQPEVRPLSAFILNLIQKKTVRTFSTISNWLKL